MASKSPKSAKADRKAENWMESNPNGDDARSRGERKDSPRANSKGKRSQSPRVRGKSDEEQAAGGMQEHRGLTADTYAQAT